MALRGVAAETSLSVARWIWKSGRTKAHGLVPWNVQSVNTDPENFRWERDKTFVRAGAPAIRGDVRVLRAEKAGGAAAGGR